METKNRKLQYIAVTVIVVFILIAGFYFLFAQSTNDLTGFEAKEIADEIALEWDSSAKLYFLGPIMDPDNVTTTGKSPTWRFDYFANVTLLANGSYSYDLKVICVKKHGEVGTPFEHHFECRDSIPPEITNWNIDSPEALNIARYNQTAQQYLNENGANYSVHSMTLRTYHISLENWVFNNSNGNPFWTIDWRNSEPYKFFRIIIDATTGESLHFEYWDLDNPP